LRNSLPAAFLVLVTVSCFADPALAQLLTDPRVVGMSGVRGDPVGNSAVYANPAGMSRAYIYAAEVLFTRDAYGHNVAGLNIVDSKTQPKLAVGASYGYQFTDSDAEITTDGHDARLAFSHPFTDRVHVGLGLRYLHLDREETDPEDPMLPEGTQASNAKGPDDLKGFTLDAGLLIDVGEGLMIGLVGENLVPIDDPATPRRAGGSIGFIGDVFSIDVDVLADFDRHPKGEAAVDLGTGLELLVADVLPLRAGYRYDGALEQSWVGGGVGFITKGSSSNGGQISISYSQNVTVSDQFLLSAGLVLFL